MSAHSFIEIGGRLLLPSREGYIPSLVALFREDELIDDGDHYGYACTTAKLRDRLQLQGFTSGRVLAELRTAVEAWHDGHDNAGADEMGVSVRDASALLSDLRAYVNSSDPWATYDEPTEVYWRMDPRSILRLAVDTVESTERPIRYNLDDLALWEIILRGSPLAEQAREQQREGVARDAPLLVLTEGSSDSLLLSEAVSVCYPHLTGFLRFMDFSAGADGSAASLARLIRSFIGAGIAHRVLGVADNDTAAYDALEKLKRERLPDDYRILHYPDLPLLECYPTLGPQVHERVPMNINGKAGSLEMYLGEDVLTLDGELVPVQWTGYIEGQRSYQGAIAKQHKSRIQEAFRDKVASVRRDPTIKHTQDWSGVEAVVEAILGAFA